MPDHGSLDLAFMGSGNAFAPQRCWSGFVLNDRYLFDLPPTALYGLKCLGAPLARIDTIFISHFHADHFFGLPFLLLEYAYETRRTAPLTLVGPPGLEERARAVVDLAYPWLFGRENGYQLRFVEVEDGREGELNGVRYEAVEVAHGGDVLQCYGYRVTAANRVLAYTGDTTYCDQLVRLGRKADVMVCDCTYASGHDNPEHMSLDEVCELQARLGEATQFVLTHVGPGVAPAGCSRMVVAADQARYRF